MTTINTNIFRNLKTAGKFPRRHQGDGQELEVEIRDDQEQSVKLQEIIDILVAAGYFRARIKGLSPFDKVVGGMTWCIELCNVDLDVDLLFQENSTIGQKIALTEKIVAVLPKLKCPHIIEPHQIQGLDFIHIYPVVQWLVKRSLENRQEMSSFVRSYALHQFNKQFRMESEHQSEQSKILDSLKLVEDVYRPHRYYKRKTAPPPDIDSRVLITLLEYGHLGKTHRTQSDSHDEKSEGSRDIDKHIQQLKKNMIVNTEELVNFEDLNDEERENVNKNYASLNRELKDGIIKVRIENHLEMLEQKKHLLIDACTKLESSKLDLEEKINNSNKSLKEIRLKKQEADAALQELETVSVENPEKHKEIEELVRLNDSLKAKQIQFREQCRKELAELQQLLEDTRNSKLNTPSEISPELSKEIEEETEKIRSLRLLLAKKNRHVYVLQRKLDEILSRTELAQYQKRFIELYNQVSAKHNETKQYYTLYNTLEDSRLYMQKQLSLLNSISENYPEAMSSSAGKEEFLTQFENILDSVRQSKLKVEHKLNKEKLERNNLTARLHSLIELQRKYAAAVGQLSIECSKHEALLAQKNNSSQ